MSVRAAVDCVFAVLLAVFSSGVLAQPDIDRSAKALELIRSFADSFCSEVPSHGKRHQIDLSVGAIRLS